jgi:DNA replication licensing factor MCM6
VCVQAQTTLVRSFKRLRGDDAAPGSHSAYRITVRQLEALVRLSEATARVFLSPVVTAGHVAEVRRGKSGRLAGQEVANA